MIEGLKYKYEWIKQLCWFIGNLFIGIFKIDYKDITEALYFVRFHFIYSNKCIIKSKLTLNKWLKNKFIELIGFIIIFIILLLFYKIFVNFFINNVINIWKYMILYLYL